MGEISTKLCQIFHQHMHQSVIQMQAYSQGKKQSEKNLASIKSVKVLLEEGYDPLHALYVHAQNMLSLFAEEISTLPPLHVWNDFASEMQEMYMPGYPPMSPLTQSFFSFWTLFDVVFGKDKESISSVYIDMAPVIGVDPFLVEIVRALLNSRMGIYEVTDQTGKEYEFTEMITGKKYNAIVPSGYRGQKGELLYVRLVPPLSSENSYHVAMTTPYVLVGTTKMEWVRYFARNGIDRNFIGYETRLNQLLKYGSSQRFWAEYVFLSYANHASDRIFLTGIPDKPETLPHSDEFNASVFDQDEVQAGNDMARNDPCSCGSGKKFKKCCLDKARSVG